MWWLHSVFISLKEKERERERQSGSFFFRDSCTKAAKASLIHILSSTWLRFEREPPPDHASPKRLETAHSCMPRPLCASGGRACIQYNISRNFFFSSNVVLSKLKSHRKSLFPCKNRQFCNIPAETLIIIIIEINSDLIALINYGARS